MRRWVASPSYRSAIGALVEARQSKGRTQRWLAAAVGKPPSFIAKIENGERRVDLVEFIAIARALGFEPSTLLGSIDGMLADPLEI
jgi:transcriptional regulator with XRE-family HTH domain